MSNAELKTVKGQPSWSLRSDRVRAYVTELGAHIAPVTFNLGNGKFVEPYSIAPWHDEAVDPSTPVIVQVLRGDFFCMPFGGNDKPYQSEKYPVHGEPANNPWTFISQDRSGDRRTLRLQMDTTIRRGRVDMEVAIVDGQTCVYSRHTLSGYAGPMNYGHHATLRFPDEPNSGMISTSKFVHGQVYPLPVEQPEERGYSILKPGATFESLDNVATLYGPPADLSRYPARRGFEDIAILVSDDTLPFAWTSVTFPTEGYAWFALKDPKVLRETLFWMSNGGRHYPPWNGRHVNVMGLEDVTSYFHTGLAESAADNSLSKAGYRTSVNLDPKRPLVVNYITGVVAIPDGFDCVQDIIPDENGAVELIAKTGKRVSVPVDLSFLAS